MKYVLSNHLSNWQLCSKIFSCNVVPVCEAYSLSCRSTAIHFIQGFNHTVCCHLFSCQQRQHGFVWGGGGRNKINQKIPDTKDLCFMCICSPSGSSLLEVGTPSCWNRSFGKQKCPRCPSLSHLFIDLVWIGPGKGERGVLEASNAFMFYGLNRWLFSIPKQKKEGILQW